MNSDPGQRTTTPVLVVGGGQSGLAAGQALRELEMPALILEASDRAVGSWPRYYDSLRLFSPAEYSSMPGLPFPAAPGSYPDRDEVADYLETYAAGLGVDVQTNTRVETIKQDGSQFVVCTADRRSLRASGIVAATGSFANPYRPTLVGERDFTGKLLHVAEYRNSAPYVGRRVVVVGAGDSAVQVASDLASVATVTLATRKPVRFIPQRLRGEDVHHWFRKTGFDALPAEWLTLIIGGTVVTDSGGYEAQLAQGRFDRRPMFERLEGDRVVWSAGQSEPVDAVILATGYRPSLEYLRALGALDDQGAPIHVGGISATHLGLVYVGLEFQRSFASNTLRGVSQDARAVIAPLVAWIRDAPAAIGLDRSLRSDNLSHGRNLRRRHAVSIEHGRSTTMKTDSTTAVKGAGQYADVNGIKLYYEAHGAGRPMILLHGGLGSGEMFGPVLPMLAESHRVVAVDLQGHGRTADIDRPIDIRLMADDIAALIDHLKLASPDVVGYSLGGGVALQTAMKYPKKIRRLVAVSANIRSDAIPPEMRAQQRQVNAAAVEFMKETPMYQLYQRVAPRPEDFPRLLDKMGASMAQGFDFTEEVRGLQVPTLIVAADADMAPPSHYVEVFKLLDGGLRDGGWMGEGRPKGGHALAILPGLTHYNIGTSPLLAAVTLDFLK